MTPGLLAEVRVVDAAGLVVAGVAGDEDLAADRARRARRSDPGRVVVLGAGRAGRGRALGAAGAAARSGIAVVS